MEYYNYHVGQVALAIVLLVGIIVIVKPSLFTYIPEYVKYRFYTRRKMVKCYEKTTRTLIKKYNEIVDRIATNRREVDDRIHEMYNSMLSKGMPENLARKITDDMNRRIIQMNDELVQKDLISVRDGFVKRHNSIAATMKETIEGLDKLFGIKNGYMPFKML